MKDPKKEPSEIPPKEPPVDAAKKKEEATPKAKGSYVFKIVPANPKNAFDFEDVADK